MSVSKKSNGGQATGYREQKVKEDKMKKRCLPITVGFILLSLVARAFTQQDTAASKITVGKPAPDFELMATDGKIKKLSGFKGKKNVLLAFYPKAGTMG